ncbi:Secretion-regulating guanine nucleotide exchange factor, partial [Dufourea novaeangliae]
GANSHGQLGQGFRAEECQVAGEVDLSDCSLEPRKINKIVGGAGHTLILDDDGRVYSCGWNNKGQTGFSVDKESCTFREIGGKLKDKVVVEVACGWDCSAALTIEGTLLLWGSNCFGQLGKNPGTLRWTYEPLEVALDRKIKRVAIGLRHIALVTEDHKVLVAGSGNKGQLGLSPSKEEELFNAAYTFTEVPTLRNIQDVTCGQHHTVAITENGNLYAFGDNRHGQLGLNTESFLKTSFPIELPDVRFNTLVKTYSGWSHVIALNDGQIFSWGRNTYGQLGMAEFKEPLSWKMMQIEGLAKVNHIAVGSEHNVVLTEDGSIFCWGWNEHGNCGNGDTRDIKFPKKLPYSSTFTAVRVGSGAGHSFALIKKS